MIVACPNCKARLRSNRTQPDPLLVVCPACQTRFHVSLKKYLFKGLIAHEDPQVGSQLGERIKQLGGDAVFCRDVSTIKLNMAASEICVLLLDVAFNGSFPFQLIERITAAGNDLHKIVLLPSVYNRTAYKKRPASLYGADAYLELHHIGDRLVPLMTELFPTLTTLFGSVSPAVTQGKERSLAAADIIGQADNLAKLLVADILLYHQPQLEQGLESGQLEQLFAEQLAEGRRLLTARLPAAADLPVDFIQQAFDSACQSYSCK